MKGHVSKSRKTFYEMVNGIGNTNVKPVSSCAVRVAGFEGVTDTEGAFSITASALPNTGYASLSVVENGHAYSTGTLIEENTDVILPAMNAAFTARAVCAYYDNQAEDDFKGMIVSVRNEKLTVKLSVEGNGTLNPIAARFIVYNAADQSTATILARNAAEGDNAKPDHSVAYEKNGSRLNASVTFNPKALMNDCDRLYVEFAVPVTQNITDAEGNVTGTETVLDWYPPVNVGYIFSKGLDLQDFVLGAIGSQGLASKFDLMGNPLANLDLGTALGLDVMQGNAGSGNLTDRTGKNWVSTRYSMNFSMTTGNPWGTTTNSADKAKKLAETADAAAKKEPEKNPSGKTPAKAKLSTSNEFCWSISPSVSFEFSVSKDVSSDSGDYYFDDLFLSVSLGFNVKNCTTINLPIGIGIVIEASLTGDITGVYYMYTDYQQSHGASVKFNQKEFGLFKSSDNNVHRRGYIGINPKVMIGLGVNVAIISVVGRCYFDFDMDFAFSDNSPTRTHGDLNISGGWAVKLLSFTVYEKTYSIKDNIHLFGEANDIKISDLLVDGEAPLSTDNVSARPQVSAANWSMRPMSTESDEASVIEAKTTDTPHTQTVPLGKNGDLLMVYVDDAGNIAGAQTRTARNARAVCWSIYSAAAGTWSAPKIIHDDGTLDDYPNICAIGDQYLVTWSSTSKVLLESEGVEEALMALDIESAVFDPETRTFGAAAYLTHNTKEDIAADVYPYASYDETTNRILLTFTKNEYQFSPEPTLAEIGGSYSALAYFYGTLDTAQKTVTWNTADDYTAEELKKVTDSGLDSGDYKTNWYGQRFLDIQLYDSNNQLATVTAMSGCYDAKNRQALIAYVVDWDGQNSTADDRDVFMLIYDYGTNKFAYNIRISNETGACANPQFSSMDGDVYLFYGSSDSSGQTDQPDAGKIMYLDVSEWIRNGSYMLTGTKPNQYYVFSQETGYTNEKGTKGSAGTVPVRAAEAVSVTNINDFDVVGSDSGITLVWTEQVKGSDSVSRQIFAAELPVSTAAETKPDSSTVGGTADPALTREESGWSQPVQLTSADQAFYTNISAEKINGKLYITAGRTSDADAGTAELVSMMHTPTSALSLGSLTFLEEHPVPGSTVTAYVEVKNNGLAPAAGGTVTFQLGSQTYLADVPSGIPGGTTRVVSTQIILPSDLSGSSVSAKLNNGTLVSADVPYEAALAAGSGEVREQSGSSIYQTTLQNTGNKDTGPLAVTVTTADGSPAGSTNVMNLAAGSVQNVTAGIRIPASAWNIDEQGTGTAKLTVTVTQTDGTVLSTGSVTATRFFNAEARKILGGISSWNSTLFSMQEGDIKDLQPGLAGTTAGDARVVWMTSSDPGSLTITGDGEIMAQKNGNYVLTGYILPKTTLVGETDWVSLVPENELKAVSAVVVVGQSMNLGITTEPVTPVNPSESTKPGTTKPGKGNSTTTQPTGGSGSTGTANGADVNQETSPKTEDSMMLWASLWISLALVSGVCLAWLVISRRKRKGGESYEEQGR